MRYAVDPEVDVDDHEVSESAPAGIDHLKDCWEMQALMSPSSRAKTSVPCCEIRDVG